MNCCACILCFLLSAWLLMFIALPVVRQEERQCKEVLACYCLEGISCNYKVLPWSKTGQSSEAGCELSKASHVMLRQSSQR